MIGDILKQLRTTNGMNQLDVCKKLNIEQSTLANYENNKRVPKLDILMKIADLFGVTVDYLLERESMETVLGFDGGDEKAETFQHKLAHQIDCAQTNLESLSEYLGVPTTIIIDWLQCKSTSYTKYYSQLSKFFDVKERYWTSPKMISPGIEPNMDEYLLILLKRDFETSGSLNTIYGRLEDFFPGITVITDPAEVSLIEDFRKMNTDSKDIVKGKIKEVLRTQRYEESTEQSEALRKASGK